MSDVLTLSPGTVLKFKGYADENTSPILAAGTPVRFDGYTKDNNGNDLLIVSPVDGGSADNVYPDEVSLDVDTDIPTINSENVSDQKLAAILDAPDPVVDEIEVVKDEPVPVEAPAKGKTKTAKATAKATKVPKAKAVAEEPVANLPAVVANQSILSVGSEELSDSDSVAMVLSEQDALEAAEALAVKAEETYFTLGGVLAHIYYGDIYKRAGFNGKRGFEEYVEQRLNINYRKAMYLIDIYTTFRRLGVDEKRLSQIGWSKAKELTKHATKENFEELVEIADTKSRAELQEYIRSELVNPSNETGERVRRTTMKFVLFADQAESVTRAINLAKERVGSDNENQALEYIAIEWLTQNEGVEVSLEDAMRALEAKYGVILSVGDGSTGITQPAE
jgi:hypothetical protein